MNTSTARLISNTRLLLFFIFLSTFYNFPLFYLFSYYLSTIISGILWLFSVKKTAISRCMADAMAEYDCLFSFAF